jgi:LmbE family N-acetylglucosaminyl deacetylase
MSIKNQTILIVAAHSDDDAFGCGGTIAKLSKNNQIFAIYFTDGVSSRRNQKSLAKSILERKRNTKKDI